MTDRGTEAAFQEIAIHEAAQDRRLRGSLEWLLLGDTYEVSQHFLEDVDHDDILEDVAERYQIGREGALRAHELCEQEIEERMNNG
ncbi:MAG: hypothetical protein U5K77_02555 [Candidatus Saccharibacteria bacterium]|nr:hypothetical protein [Candidatus Saccharibacteria bacterium]